MNDERLRHLPFAERQAYLDRRARRWAVALMIAAGVCVVFGLVLQAVRP